MNKLSWRGHHDLNLQDLKNIETWFEKAFFNSEEAAEDENETIIKIRAMMIYRREEEDYTDRFRKRFR